MPAAVVPSPLGLGLAVVASIDQYQVQALKALLGQVLQGGFAADPVVFVGRPDMGGEQQAAGVDDELALAALDFFVAVKAFVQHALLAAFDGLGIEHRHARTRLPRRGRALAVAAHQGLVEPRPAPVRLPAPKIVVDQWERRKLVRQEPPLATALGEVKQRIDNQAQRMLAAACVGQYFLNNLPLEISQVRFVHLWSDEKIR